MKKLSTATSQLKYRKTCIALLAALVVGLTSYALIVPAITLDEDTAETQSGIDVAAEDSSETVSDTDEENTEDAVETDSMEATETAVDVDVKTTISDAGKSYDVNVTYGENAGIPDNAELSVEEISENSGEYEKLLARTEETIGKDKDIAFAKFFDIKIIDADGEKVTIQAPVDVEIRLTDEDDVIKSEENMQVVHFADGKKKGDVVEDFDVEGSTVSFSADGFSAYAIVAGPDAVPIGWGNVESVSEVAAHGEDGLYIGHVDGYFMTSGITQINASRTGITKTKPAQNSPPAAAVKYYFESVGDAGDQFRIYCMQGDTRKYVIQTTNSLNFTEDANEANVFTVEAFGTQENTFRIEGNDNYFWNMQGGANGASFAAYTGATDNNARLHFWYFDTVTNDPYGLDGKSYGLMNWTGGVAGKALMSEVSGDNRLEAKALTVMANGNNNEDKLFVPDESDISMWKFHWIEDDNYYLTTVQDGSTKYLKIEADGLSLVSDQSEASRIQVVPGSGIHAGEISLQSGGTSLTYSGNIDTGFQAGGQAGNEWLHFVEMSELTSDYFMTYSASKVSVSDSSLTTGSKLIVYTRAWNEEKKRYEFFAIDKDGNLVQCYESGNSIEWVGGRLNEMLWQLTEYTDETTGEPNGFYELYNEYSEQYIAPQITDNQILSDDTIGINLNGRRNGQYYTSILAWDDISYTYAGFKVENGQIVSCPKSEAMDFYFAVMEEIPIDDVTHTVPTVDNKKHGITMKLIDIGTRSEMSDFLGNDEGGIGTVLHQGLLSTDLGADGYPTAVGGSLETLYHGAQEVNHLFIDSTYNGTGYFEYDSAQNFATLGNAELDDPNSFTVYKELGSYDSIGARNTLKHGQFFPFNHIEPGLYTSINRQNLYSTTGSQLPDTDPRKYEQLYLLKEPVDCYFAVELEASFVQTPSGLDAWGHDIIYEFTGDDDFWLYVDGELVID